MKASTEPGSLGSLAQQWRKEADELDKATRGQWVEPAVKRECADDLDACRASLEVALQELEKYLDFDALQDPELARQLKELRTRIGA